MLQHLLFPRIQWINQVIQPWLAAENDGAVENWSFPEAAFPPRAEIQAFLRGPEMSMVLTGLNGAKHARNFVNKYISDGENCAFSMEPSGSSLVIEKDEEYFKERDERMDELYGEMLKLQEMGWAIPMMQAAPVTGEATHAVAD